MTAVSIGTNELTKPLWRGLNDKAIDKIKRHSARMGESMDCYSDEVDAMLHLRDVHDQFKAIAALLGYGEIKRIGGNKPRQTAECAA